MANKTVVQINPKPVEKRSIWDLNVRQQVVLTVDFGAGNLLTQNEAVDRFNDDDYDDIIDEDVISQWAEKHFQP